MKLLFNPLLDSGLQYLNDEKKWATVSSNSVLSPGYYRVDVSGSNVSVTLSGGIGDYWVFTDSIHTINPNEFTIGSGSDTFTDENGVYQAGPFILDTTNTTVLLFKTGANDYDVITINGDFSSMYQLLSEKGQANGYTPLDGTGKVPLIHLPFTTPLIYRGTWNASTNTPTLADGVGTVGDVYIVSVAGTQNLGSGVVNYNVQDLVVYNGTTWQRIGGGTTQWGTITGTLSSQTDLQNALNLKENVSNKVINFAVVNNTVYPTTQAVVNYVTSFTPNQETIQDLAFAALTNTPTVELIYDDPVNQVRANVRDNSIDNTKLSTAPANTVKGNNTNATGNVVDISLTTNTVLGRINGINSGNIAPQPVQITLTGRASLVGGTFTLTNANLTTNSYAIVTFSTIGTSTSVPIKYTANAGSITFSTGQPTDNGEFAYLIFV